MEYNQESFALVKSAAVAKTFYEARAILSEIDTLKITDPDLDEFVKYCNDLVDFCIEYGIQKQADMDLFAILTTTDYGKLIKSALIDPFWGNDPFVGLNRLVGEGAKLTFLTLTWYTDTYQKLLQKY